MLENKAYPNIRNNFNCTPFHRACNNENLQVDSIKIFLDNRVDRALPYFIDHFGWSPLDYAKQKKNQLVVKAIMEFLSEQN